MKSLHRKTTPVLLLGCALLLASCSEKPASPAASSPAATPAASDTLAKVFSAAPAGAPVAIHQARTTAKPGEVITLTGLVMGNEKPFVEGRAAFILGDPAKLTPCNKNPGDGCKTPWDVCCDTPEAVKASTATIQVVGADGKVLKEGIENRNGLKPLSNITVSGTVADGSNADVLVLNASAIKVVE